MQINHKITSYPNRFYSWGRKLGSLVFAGLVSCTPSIPDDSTEVFSFLLAQAAANDSGSSGTSEPTNPTSPVGQSAVFTVSGCTHSFSNYSLIVQDPNQGLGYDAFKLTLQPQDLSGTPNLTGFPTIYEIAAASFASAGSNTINLGSQNSGDYQTAPERILITGEYFTNGQSAGGTSTATVLIPRDLWDRPNIGAYFYVDAGVVDVLNGISASNAADSSVSILVNQSFSNSDFYAQNILNGPPVTVDINAGTGAELIDLTPMLASYSNDFGCIKSFDFDNFTGTTLLSALQVGSVFAVKGRFGESGGRHISIAQIIGINTSQAKITFRVLLDGTSRSTGQSADFGTQLP